MSVIVQKIKEITKVGYEVIGIITGIIESIKKAIKTFSGIFKQAAPTLKSANEDLSVANIAIKAIELILAPVTLLNGLRSGGEFRPLNKNKLKISSAVAKILGSAVVLGLGAAALVIPGVAPIFGVVAAGAGLAVSVYQLFIAAREYKKAKSDLKELNVLVLKTSNPNERLTSEQQERLNYLQSKREELIEKSNLKKIRDLTIQGVAIAGVALAAIGLFISLFFPPAGLAIVTVGAAIGVASGFVKLGCVIYDHIQKKRALAVAAGSPTVSLASPTVSPASPTVSPASPTVSLASATVSLASPTASLELRFFAPKKLAHNGVLGKAPTNSV